MMFCKNEKPNVISENSKYLRDKNKPDYVPCILETRINVE